MLRIHLGGIVKKDTIAVGFTTEQYIKKRLEDIARAEKRSLSSLLNKIASEAVALYDREATPKERKSKNLA